MGLASDLKEFFKDFKVMSLAVAFIMGTTIYSLIISLVNNIIMPVILPFTNSWETATIIIGPVTLRWGAFLSSLINFMIIVLVLLGMIKLSKRK